MKIQFFLILLVLNIGLSSAQHSHDENTAHDHDSITSSSITEETETQDEQHGEADEAITPELSGVDQEVKASLDTFPNLHPLIVHFPIVLLLLGAILQLIQLFVLKRNLDWVILLCVGVGFIGAYVAGVYAHPHAHDLTETAKKVLEQHDIYAEWTIYSSALASILKLGSLFLIKRNRIFEIVTALVLVFAAYSVSEAGHYGAQLVYLEGVGPQGKFLESKSADGENGEGHSH